ncbi:MAG: GxxExxY protein [Rhodospirillales bacterium]|nr:GxxExxY protein [Rhodospirillales bacterium]MBT4041250.1 GxxExxY protein [Rhodospirillales bacterium]MBT4626600.1 GxxExxY protein [Rhodospirillales bacterium]MBT5350340.1 GxxExxY protein [Rhodospirillales bacterium]MBT6110263.1 GxxExxY protein [Rhodospirillales bacterium]
MNHRDTETQRVSEERDPVTEKVIGLAIEVHRHLGPGLLESAYEECLCYEFTQASIPFSRQVALPVIYKNVNLDCGYRMDIVVDELIILELKTVEKILPIHHAQLMTYLKLGNMKTGLLMNFNNAVLKDGIKRVVL